MDKKEGTEQLLPNEDPEAPESRYGLPRKADDPAIAFRKRKAHLDVLVRRMTRILEEHLQRHTEAMYNLEFYDPLEKRGKWNSPLARAAGDLSVKVCKLADTYLKLRELESKESRKLTNKQVMEAALERIGKMGRNDRRAFRKLLDELMHSKGD